VCVSLDTTEESPPLVVVVAVTRVRNDTYRVLMNLTNTLAMIMDNHTSLV